MMRVLGLNSQMSPRPGLYSDTSDVFVVSVTSCSRLWSSVSTSSSELFLTPGSSRHRVEDVVSDMERRGDEGLPAFGGTGRGKLWTLVMEPVWENLFWGWTEGRGGRGLRAGGGEGAGEGAASSDAMVASERAWRRISKFWAASLYCW